MKIVMFYHSLVSDWNHGNAHFLRGVVAELLSRGHDVRVYEPADGWSLANLREQSNEQGNDPLREFQMTFPVLRSIEYDLATLDLDQAIDGAELVIVHEWNAHELVARIGEHRQRQANHGKHGKHDTGGKYALLFHDTHHRAVTDPSAMANYDLRHYDGVLAFGEVLRRLYLSRGWTRRAWTWHEAADTRLFRPLADRPGEGDLIWVGNWGDEERTAELHEFLLKPVKSLGLKARVYGVRYPDHALAALAEAGIEYGGYLPNHRVPDVFARFKVTMHVPRRPYTQALPGIPTIRVFEALACGIPLVCAPWEDAEHLFTPGRDYLVARDGAEMRQHLAAIVNEPQLARDLSDHGRRTILARHTCAHRVDQLMEIVASLELPAATEGEGRANARQLIARD